jgi:WD40-like Beta Propeller Repeat
MFSRLPSRSRQLPALAALVALVLAYAQPSAQGKKPLTVDDYTKWKSINDSAISGDGKWVTYVLRTTNVPDEKSNPVLHLLNLESNQDVAVPNATGGTFSPDSKWLAYQVDPAPGRRGRGGRGGNGTTPGSQPGPATPPAPTDPGVPPGAPAPPGSPSQPATPPNQTPAPAQPGAVPGATGAGATGAGAKGAMGATRAGAKSVGAPRVFGCSHRTHGTVANSGVSGLGVLESRERRDRIRHSGTLAPQHRHPRTPAPAPSHP